MEDAIKKLIDLSEKIGNMDAKLDDVLEAQKSSREDIDLIKSCYTEHSERITKAEEKIIVLDRQKAGVTAAIITLLIGLIGAVVAHIFGK